MPSRACSILVSVALLLQAWQAAKARAAPGTQTEPVLQPDSGWINNPNAPVAVRLRAEFGALAVLEHRIRYGPDGTNFNYRSSAAQNTLFFFARYSAELEIRARHTLIFLYQPFDLNTEQVLERDLEVGDVTFAAGTPTRFGYGFDFYRLDYQYELRTHRRVSVAVGGGFQIRNARVSFVSADGSTAFTQAGAGFVPLLRLRTRYLFDSAVFLESELDGFVTPIPGGRGPDDQIPYGAILDAALRAGVLVTHWSEAFLTLRYLGGGYRGNSSEGPGLPEDARWTSNWLHTLIFSVGVGLR